MSSFEGEVPRCYGIAEHTFYRCTPSLRCLHADPLQTDVQAEGFSRAQRWPNHQPQGASPRFGCATFRAEAAGPGTVR